MKFELRTEITIGASPTTVWATLTTLDRYDEWNPFITSSDGEVAVGARLINRMSPPGGKAVTFKPTVTVVEPERTFEWLGRLGIPGLFDGRHRFELHPTEDGATHLIHSEQFQGLLVRPFKRSLKTQTLAGFEAMNHALKERAEAAVTS